MTTCPWPVGATRATSERGSAGRTNLLFMLGGDRPVRLSRDEERLPPASRESRLPRPIRTGRPSGGRSPRASPRGTAEAPVVLYHPRAATNVPRCTFIRAVAVDQRHAEWPRRWPRPARVGVDRAGLGAVAREAHHGPRAQLRGPPVQPVAPVGPLDGCLPRPRRAQADYRSVFAGAAASPTATTRSWGLRGARNDVINHADRDWIDALMRPGGRQAPPVCGGSSCPGRSSTGLPTTGSSRRGRAKRGLRIVGGP